MSKIEHIEKTIEYLNKAVNNIFKVMKGRVANYIDDGIIEMCNISEDSFYIRILFKNSNNEYTVFLDDSNELSCRLEIQTNCQYEQSSDVKIIIDDYETIKSIFPKSIQEDYMLAITLNKASYDLVCKSESEGRNE